MGSVQRLILGSASTDFTVVHLSTWESSSLGLQKIADFIRSFVHFFILLLLGKVDLAHIHISERGSLLRKFSLSTTANLFSVPVVMHAHGCEFHVFYQSSPAFLKRIISACLRQCACLIVLSDSWKDFYVKSCGLTADQVVVLKNPVVFPDFIPHRQGGDTITFAFMGKLNQRKGVYDIVNALALLDPHERSGMRIELGGSGETQAIQDLAKSLGVQDLIHFHGWVNEELRNQILAGADVFLLPSYNEGLPMALLEAMSWSLPSISTPVGGIPEVIDHGFNGLLVHPGDVTGLASAMALLRNDAELRLRLGHCARESICGLDLETYLTKICNIYLASTRTFCRQALEKA
ncbi:glycosyltransferase family 4 protein [Leptolyngbya sp. CCNP1308]|uniref:glycosyltransferase family 4 protein n=1 Tax=Leptolyngbya sp. CCNP1308 TaxID=3110255 RepID=UPI002B1F8166|nr:glycosyltransferase family 4 protein [Leptolyngbya sp. CCNP1308]MEA5448470.1 glycosyltransferase family 4 protein [Leptolyngbya sp. CCNP1308]